MHEYQRKSLPPGTSVVGSGRLSAPAEAPGRDPWMGHSRKDGGSSLSALLFCLTGPQQSLRTHSQLFLGPRTKDKRAGSQKQREREFHSGYLFQQSSAHRCCLSLRCFPDSTSILKYTDNYCYMSHLRKAISEEIYFNSNDFFNKNNIFLITIFDISPTLEVQTLSCCSKWNLKRNSGITLISSTVYEFYSLYHFQKTIVEKKLK